MVLANAKTGHKLIPTQWHPKRAGQHTSITCCVNCPSPLLLWPFQGDRRRCLLPIALPLSITLRARGRGNLHERCWAVQNLVPHPTPLGTTALTSPFSLKSSKTKKLKKASRECWSSSKSSKRRRYYEQPLVPDTKITWRIQAAWTVFNSVIRENQTYCPIFKIKHSSCLSVRCQQIVLFENLSHWVLLVTVGTCNLLAYLQNKVVGYSSLQHWRGKGAAAQYF